MTAPHVLIANIFFAPYTYGGATIVAEEVARALAQRHGWQVSVLSAVSRIDLPPYAVRKIQTGEIPNFVINLPPSRPYAQMYCNSQVAEAAGRLIQSLAPDLVHAHCIQELGTGVIRAARQEGLPVVVSAHDFWWICERQFMIRPDGRYCGQDPVDLNVCRGCVLDMSQTRTRQLQLKQSMQEVDLVTYPSEFARDLCHRSGLLPQREAVWQNGVRHPGPGFFRNQARRRRTHPTPVFGYCGGPSDIKGWPLIRKAFEGLERSDFKVLLADGSMDGSWWKDSEFAALPGTWKVHPRYSQDEMDGFWQNIDVLLFPSQWKETFGLTIREALCRGIRVIQTNSGGTVEHTGPDRDRVFPIGARPEALRAEILHALARLDPWPDPVAVPDFDSQADHFAELVQPLLHKTMGMPTVRPVQLARSHDPSGSAARTA
ncbi:glycosyltransferase [Pseudooceanicola algae]|uniref:Uncharacterized protein n=1 Tax=Pseudooceanicola algae TaxID=1537215 RepID=A0A418SIW3_9RHOB|nr:glycosyltransferase [Pseudooceanicola algae]QPM91195.1 hypothetical protein PSAL_024450 [Pseudooceanicola algae]